MAEQLLSGIKVLDLTWHIAGPFCTKMLAGYGADVLKIERPGEGDPSRGWPPYLNDDPHPEKSIHYHHLNLNKRSITLDLKSDIGKEIVKRLVADVDIVVENFSPGVMDRLGLGYDVLEAINPRLVMTSLSNFGSTGPYRDFKASELILNGLGHDQYSNGVDGREPLKVGGNAETYVCGYSAAGATLGAYWLASEIEEGQWLDLSMQEILANCTSYKTINMTTWAYTGRPSASRRDPRTAVATILPTGTFPCKDGFVTFSAEWPRLRALVATNPELAELRAILEPYTWDDVYNIDNKGLFDVYWVPWCMSHTKRELMEICQAVPLFCTAVQTPLEVITDPQMEARGYWMEVDHPVVGKQIHCGAPADTYDAPWAVTRPVPLLGQHNEEVYCGQMGYSREDLARLRESGIV